MRYPVRTKRRKKFLEKRARKSEFKKRKKNLMNSLIEKYSRSMSVKGKREEMMEEYRKGVTMIRFQMGMLKWQ